MAATLNKGNFEMLKVDAKPKTETERLFAIDKPSLENLSYCLRHPETWPDGFVWDYSQCDQCAMGLAHALLPYIPAGSNDSNQGCSLMAKAFAIPYSAARTIFFGAGWAPRKFLWWRPWRATFDHRAVTPEMVADQIDAHLARTS